MDTQGAVTSAADVPSLVRAKRLDAVPRQLPHTVGSGIYNIHFGFFPCGSKQYFMCVFRHKLATEDRTFDAPAMGFVEEVFKMDEVKKVCPQGALLPVDHDHHLDLLDELSQINTAAAPPLVREMLPYTLTHGIYQVRFGYIEEGNGHLLALLLNDFGRYTVPDRVFITGILSHEEIHRRAPPRTRLNVTEGEILGLLKPLWSMIG